MSAVAELEQRLATPPPGLDPALARNPLAVAHAVLEALRESGDEQCLFLRSILELQPLPVEKEELFFHCLTGVRQVGLWQWNKQYSADFLTRLRDYLMTVGHYLASSTSPGARTCRLAAYTASVAFWKRGWNETASSTPLSEKEQALLAGLGHHHVVSLASPDDLLPYLATLQIEPQALYLTCLVGEFAGKSAIAYRLPIEFHKVAHRSFERTTLLQCLEGAMRGLGQCLTALNQGETSPMVLQETLAVLQLTLDVLGWEFGLVAFSSSSLGAAAASQTLRRPPVEWRPYVARTDLVGALWAAHATVQQGAVRHLLRQVLLQLASLSGPVLAQATDRRPFASSLMEGCLPLLEQSCPKVEESDLLDTLQIIARLVGNFRLALLVELPTLVPLLQRMTSVGQRLLGDQVADCRDAGGDIESMEHREWREEALRLLLECAVLLCSDPWLLYSGTEESRKQAQVSLSSVLGPLYEGFVTCRTQMAAMEEHYLVSNEADLDEVKEEILETELEEELDAVSTVGRLNLSAAIGCLSQLFGQTMPQLQSLWSGSGEVTPQTAALLEESRLLTMYVCQLLTDNNEGETSAIPDAVVMACQDQPGLAGDIASAVQALLNFAESQVQKIAENPSNRRLSPMLAKSFLWFLHRWAPAYIYPASYGARSNASNQIVQEWSTPEKAQQAVTFCVSLCLQYQCYWPHEPQVQESAGKLLLALANRGGNIRSSMVASPVFHQMVRFHCLTAGQRHSASHQEFEAAVRAKVGDGAMPSLNMVWGYQRLPYTDKARILTAILVACSDTSDAAANSMISDSLEAIHDAFTGLTHALSTNQVTAEDVHAKEMACLCVEMFCGVAHASEMAEAERIPQFITGYLPQLSGLMAYYAKDLTICETLLRFFRDYTEQFIAILNREQSLALFNASAELLKSYSHHHCQARVIQSAAQAEAEEDKAYGDILCAIQLLINLGAKDFIDACSTNDTQSGIDSNQVTDMIFFGLQQIIPLMTQGLLQFPTLCLQFFELVGFMMDTYPEKVCVLPYHLFDSLLESLLHGMSHYNTAVAQASLHGLASLAKEHLASGRLAPHLAAHPDLMDRCTRRLLRDVVFQTSVVDRVEAAGMALLHLAAVDVKGFVSVVAELVAQVGDERQRQRLQAAFATLMDPTALSKVGQGGYEARLNRARFKQDFQDFCHEVHSFLVVQ